VSRILPLLVVSCFLAAVPMLAHALQPLPEKPGDKAVLLGRYFLLKGDYARMLNMKAVVRSVSDPHGFRLAGVSTVTGRDLPIVTLSDPYLQSSYSYKNHLRNEFDEFFTKRADAQRAADRFNAVAASGLHGYIQERYAVVKDHLLVVRSVRVEDDLLRLSPAQRLPVIRKLEENHELLSSLVAE